MNRNRVMMRCTHQPPQRAVDQFMKFSQISEFCGLSLDACAPCPSSEAAPRWTSSEEVLPHEGNIDPIAQKPIAQRDNHTPGCWIANRVTTHLNGSRDVDVRPSKAWQESDGGRFVVLH